MKRVSVSKFNGGLVNKVNPKRIPENTLTEAENYEYRKNSLPKKRMGTEQQELTESGRDNVYNFDVWYPNRELTDILGDKIYVLHTKGQDTPGIIEPPHFEPWLAINPEYIDYGYVIAGDVETESYAVTGGYLIDVVILKVENPNFTICETEDGDYVDNITITPSSGSVSSTIYVRYSPTTTEFQSGRVGHTSVGVDSLNLVLTADAIDLPAKDYLMWWLEPFYAGNDIPTFASSEMEDWDSIDPAVTFEPVAQVSPEIAAADLQPIESVVNLVDADTDTSVGIFRYKTIASVDSGVRQVGYNFGDTEGFDNSFATSNGVTFACVFNASEESISTRTGRILAHLYGETGVNITKGFYFGFSGADYANLNATIRNTSFAGTTYKIANVALGDATVHEGGWCILVGMLNPSNLTVNFYLGIDDTIYQYAETALTGAIGSANLNSALFENTKVTVGGIRNTTLVANSCECLQATSVAWRHRLDTAEITQIFKYYKNKYPYVFSYDETTIT